MPAVDIAGVRALELDASGPLLGSEASALDLVAATAEADAALAILPVERFEADFFRLSTRKAGFFFEKCTQYGLHLAIIGEFPEAVRDSRALADFIREANRGALFRFAESRDELEHMLA